MQGIKKATPLKGRMEEVEDSDEDATKIFFGAGNNDEEQSQAVESTAIAETINDNESIQNPRLIKLHSDSETSSNKS